MKTLNLQTNDNIIMFIITFLFLVWIVGFLMDCSRALEYEKKKQLAIKNSIEKTESKTYTEKELEDFGNYLLSDQRRKALKEKANKVNNTDLFNWKRKELEQVIVNEFKYVKNS